MMMPFCACDKPSAPVSLEFTRYNAKAMYIPYQAQRSNNSITLEAQKEVLYFLITEINPIVSQLIFGARKVLNYILSPKGFYLAPDILKKAGLYTGHCGISQ